jgi:hypothetical protein
MEGVITLLEIQGVLVVVEDIQVKQVEQVIVHQQVLLKVFQVEQVIQVDRVLEQEEEVLQKQE